MQMPRGSCWPPSGRLRKIIGSSPHHMAQHHPTGSETSPSYASRSSRFGSEPPSVEDDVDVWRYTTVSYLPETTTCRVGAVKRWFCPSVCLSVAYIVNNSRRRKLVGRYASTHVTGTPVSTSKGQSWRSSGPFILMHIMNDIFGTVRLMNFTVGTEVDQDDLRHP